MADLANLLHDQLEIEKVAKDKSTDPAAARIRDAIRTQRRTIDDLNKAARLQVVEQLKSQSKASEATAQSLELERQLLTAQLRRTVAQIESQAEAIQKLERFNGDAEELRAEIEHNQGVVKDMADTLTRWTIELDAPPRVSVLEPAG
jgi:predicted Zn-dependent peptidase